LIIGDNYRTLRYASAKDETDRRVIDIENDAEIWAEEIDSDYDYESDEGYDGALLDLDVQTIDGKSTLPSNLNLY
jgi:ribosomal protein S18 acetylase RimI-like enzyme